MSPHHDSRIERRRFSLRSTLTAVTIVVALLAVIVSGSFVALTTILERTTVSAAASVESVHLAEQAEVDLLLLERSADPLVRAGIEADLRHRLAQATRFVTTDDEKRALSAATTKVSAYLEERAQGRLEASRQAQHLEDAFGALDTLVTMNVEQAREAGQTAADSDRIATILGIATSGLMLLVAGGGVYWLRRIAFAPVFSLAATMERFGRGDRTARAVEDGPSDLVEMSRRFNEMAAALSSERQLQMASLGGVAHDLRNPLSVLKMATAMMPPERQFPPEATMRQIIQKMDRQIVQLERMLADFLDMAKIDAGELELRIDLHDARTLLRDAVALFDGATSSHDIALQVPDDALIVACDPLRFEQVATNLLSNAIKYSPPGTRIEVTMEARGETALLRVTDHGPGIARQDQLRVFEPFQRVGLFQGSVPGVGLGLFVVRRIVEAHGGRIELDSAPGQGATFTVHLPRRAAPRQPTNGVAGRA